MTELQRNKTTKMILAVVLALSTLSAAAAADDPTGAWEGAIHLPAGELRIMVELICNDANGSNATIDIPAQGLRGFALSNVRCVDGGAHFEMEGIPGVPTFDGELDEAGEILAGEFRQGPQSLSFTLERSDGSAADDEPEQSEPIPGEGVEGDWLGLLRVGPAELRLALQVEPAPDGSWSATLNSLDQGAVVPVDALVFSDGEVTISLPAIQASYEGRLNSDGSRIEGEWTQGGRVLPLAFERQAGPVAQRLRPQDPRPPFPYRTEGVVFRNEAAALDLAGTLVVPPGEGPFPTVLFVSGSGPQDRDEQLMGHRPFLVIADHLARHGIASLRFDDRGVGGSGGDHFGSTVEEFATDVEAALAFLRSRPEVSEEAVGILGHSEGGLTGPMVAARDDRVAFVIALAPPAVPLDELLTRQTRDLLRLRGVDDELIDRLADEQAAELALVRDISLSEEALRQAMQRRMGEREERYSEAELAALDLDEASIEQAIDVASSAWFRSLIRIDPGLYWSRIEAPVLALFGEKDVQVAPSENAAALRRALEAAGNEAFDVRVLPGLNHLFQTAETGGIEEYGAIEETISPGVLRTLADWIAARGEESSLSPS